MLALTHMQVFGLPHLATLQKARSLPCLRMCDSPFVVKLYETYNSTLESVLTRLWLVRLEDSGILRCKPAVFHPGRWKWWPGGGSFYLFFWKKATRGWGHVCWLYQFPLCSHEAQSTSTCSWSWLWVANFTPRRSERSCETHGPMDIRTLPCNWLLCALFLRSAVLRRQISVK